jgi:hypothetical protein
LAERAVWPMAVVVLGVLGQHGCDVPLIEDQGANSSDSAIRSPRPPSEPVSAHVRFGERRRSGPTWRQFLVAGLLGLARRRWDAWRAR